MRHILCFMFWCTHWRWIVIFMLCNCVPYLVSSFKYLVVVTYRCTLHCCWAPPPPLLFISVPAGCGSAEPYVCLAAELDSLLLWIFFKYFTAIFTNQQKQTNNLSPVGRRLCGGTLEVGGWHHDMMKESLTVGVVLHFNTYCTVGSSVFNVPLSKEWEVGIYSNPPPPKNCTWTQNKISLAYPSRRWEMHMKAFLVTQRWQERST